MQIFLFRIRSFLKIMYIVYILRRIHVWYLVFAAVFGLFVYGCLPTNTDSGLTDYDQDGVSRRRRLR